MDDDLLAGIDRWLADAAAADRAAAEASEARQVRRLAEALAAEDDLRSTLLAVADAAMRVVVRLTGTERQLRGRVVAAGDDFVVLRDADDAPPALVPLSTIASVRLPSGAAWPGGVGEAETELGRRRRRRGSLRALLAGLAAETPEVQLVGTTETRAGTLRLVGADLVVIEEASAERAAVVVPMAAIAAVVLLESM